MRDLQGKTVIVTGASAGLGRAIAIAFAQAGARVGLIARTEDGLNSVQAEIAKSASVEIAIVVADMGDPQQVANAAVSLETKLGPPDIWVNNAMETIFSRFVDVTPEEFRRVTEVTYLGIVYGTMEAVRRMISRGRGHIIQIGSALAYRSIPLQSAYCGGKFAIRGFTDSLRSELIHDRSRIRLTMVHMPALNTPQFSWARTHIDRQPQPVGIIFQPELGAEAVVHAARYPRREYWVGGPTILAIIGNMFFPGLMDWLMARMSYEQQWVQKVERSMKDGNLFQPADVSLHATCGQFSSRAVAKSLTWSITRQISKLFSW